MGFKKGEPRPANAGRKKGVPNVTTQLLKRLNGVAEAAAILEEYSYDPLRALLEIDKRTSDDVVKMQIAGLLMPFRYPKLKPEERKQDNPFDRMTPQERLATLKELIMRLEAKAKVAEDAQLLPAEETKE